MTTLQMYTKLKGQIDNPLTLFFADLDTVTPRREVSPAEVKSRSFRSDCNVYTQEGRRGNVSKRLMSHIPAVTDQPSKRELQPDGCSQLGTALAGLGSGPVMHIHPVCMGVHMLGSKLYEHPVSWSSE